MDEKIVDRVMDSIEESPRALEVLELIESGQGTKNDFYYLLLTLDRDVWFPIVKECSWPDIFKSLIVLVDFVNGLFDAKTFLGNALGVLQAMKTTGWFNKPYLDGDIATLARYYYTEAVWDILHNEFGFTIEDCIRRVQDEGLPEVRGRMQDIDDVIEMFIDQDDIDTNRFKTVNDVIHAAHDAGYDDELKYLVEVLLDASPVVYPKDYYILKNNYFVLW